MSNCTVCSRDSEGLGHICACGWEADTLDPADGWSAANACTVGIARLAYETKIDRILTAMRFVNPSATRESIGRVGPIDFGREWARTPASVRKEWCNVR